MIGANERLRAALQRSRIIKYRALSTCQGLSGSPVAIQPVLFLGEGRIVLGREVEFGYENSMAFYSGYCHVEASKPGALIEFGDHVQVNNNAVIKSEGPGIRIGAEALLGSAVTIYDSDFHDLRPERRRGGQPKMAAVELGENVFIGDRVMILKGVSVGANSVIGAGSVLRSSIPAGVIAAGNPARDRRSSDRAELTEPSRATDRAELTEPSRADRAEPSARPTARIAPSRPLISR